MPQTVDADPPVGLPCDAFQPVDTSLCRPVAPDEGQPGAPGPHRRPVQRLMQARGSDHETLRYLHLHILTGDPDRVAGHSGLCRRPEHFTGP